jgi:hypothetical protein
MMRIVSAVQPADPDMHWKFICGGVPSGPVIASWPVMALVKHRMGWPGDRSSIAARTRRSWQPELSIMKVSGDVLRMARHSSSLSDDSLTVGAAASFPAIRTGAGDAFLDGAAGGAIRAVDFVAAGAGTFSGDLAALADGAGCAPEGAGFVNGGGSTRATTRALLPGGVLAASAGGAGGEGATGAD